MNFNNLSYNSENQNNNKVYVIDAVKRQGDPNPIKTNTPAMRRNQEIKTQNMYVPPIKQQLHTSIIAQPSINKEKQIEKQLKNKERLNEGRKLLEEEMQNSITLSHKKINNKI